MAAPTIDVNALPDNIILDILSYLPVKDRCISGSVCRRWRRIVQDKSLWRHVDLLPYVLSLNKLWKVIRAHFSDCLLTIKLGGFLDPNSPKLKKHSLSNAMLKDLQERCPNMQSLTLVRCNTDNLDCKNLPTSLKHLAIRKCGWTPQWLMMAPDDLDLCRLDLTDTVRVDNLDLVDITEKFPKLQQFVLNSCYRVGESGLEKVATTLTDLTHLELSETSCSDLSIHHISRNLSKLKLLNLSRCGQVSQSSLATIAGGLNYLEYLDLSGCNQFKLDGLSQLALSSSLRKLVLGKTKLEQTDLDTLRTTLGEKIEVIIPDKADEKVTSK